MTPSLEVTPYDSLDDLNLLALCVWREARGEGMLGKRGVAHVITNRVQHGGYGLGFHGVILKPWQFSSFNANDPNSRKWPLDGEADWLDCLDAAKAVTQQTEEDFTKGSLFYFSRPLTAPPHAWGPVEIMLTVGHLTFCKPIPPTSSGDIYLEES